jgi:outer membrane murein-binding lipoprotein Lpp
MFNSRSEYLEDKKKEHAMKKKAAKRDANNAEGRAEQKKAAKRDANNAKGRAEQRV